MQVFYKTGKPFLTLMVASQTLLPINRDSYANIQNCLFSLDQEHIETCELEVIPCPYRHRGCEEVLQRRNIEKHAKEQCQLKDYVCSSCHQVVTFRTLQVSEESSSLKVTTEEKD